MNMGLLPSKRVCVDEYGPVNFIRGSVNFKRGSVSTNMGLPSVKFKRGLCR